MAGEVALVGLRVAPRGCAGARYVRLPAEAVDTRKLSEFEWIVLGDDAIESRDPIRAAESLRGLRARVLLAPENCPRPVLVGWFAAGMCAIVEPHEVPERVGSRRRLPERPATPRHEWLGVPVEPGSPAERIVLAVEQSDPLTVEAVARRLGCSRRSMPRRSRACFGLTATEVIARYADFLDRVWQASGISPADCAAALGLPSQEALWEFRRRRGRGRSARRESGAVSENPNSDVRSPPVRPPAGPGDSASSPDDGTRHGRRGPASGRRE